MAKYSAEELSGRVNELELDDDVKISLMEDITDSISNEESEELTTLKEELDKTKEELDKKEEEYDALKEKYKSRFLESTIDVQEDKKEDEDLEEKEIIDIKEI